MVEVDVRLGFGRSWLIGVIAGGTLKPAEIEMSIPLSNSWYARNMASEQTAEEPPR